MEPTLASPGLDLSALSWVLPHAAPLVLSCLLMTAGMLVARFGKGNKAWLSIHRPLGGTAALLGLIGLGSGLWMVATSSGIHFRVPHAFLGALTLLVTLATPIAGQAMFSAKAHKQEIRKAHRWLGRSAIVLMLLTIVSGLAQAGIIPLAGFPR